MAFPTVNVFENYAATAGGDFDAVILIGDFAEAIPDDFSDYVSQAQQFDARVGKQALLVPADVAGGR